MLNVKVKKLHPEAVVPQYAKVGDAGLDLTAVSVELLGKGKVAYGTGLAFEIPDGYVGLLFPRSSIHKYSLDLTNCVGVIDSGYRGEVKAVFRLTDYGHFDKMYSSGERVAQLLILPYPAVTLREVDELSDSERGFGGFGSTGK